MISIEQKPNKTPLPQVTALKEILNPLEAIPSNWVITGQGTDSLYAINSQTQREFTGTIADFNKMLKG